MCIYLYIVDIYIKISLSDQFLYGMQHWAKIGEVHFKRFLILLRISIMNATHMGQCVSKELQKLSGWRTRKFDEFIPKFLEIYEHMTILPEENAWDLSLKSIISTKAAGVQHTMVF